MKKIISLLSVLAVCTLIIVGVYAWFGVKIEQRTAVFMEEIDQADYLKSLLQEGVLLVENTSYKRGIFNSRAETAVTFRPYATAQTDDTTDALRFKAVHLIHHGPISIVCPTNGTKSLRPVLAAIESKIVTEPGGNVVRSPILHELLAPFEANSTVFVDMKGNVELKLVTSSISKDIVYEGIPAKIDWKGMVALYTNFTGEENYSIEFGEIDIIADDMSSHLGNITIGSFQHKGEFDLKFGETNFTLASLSINTESPGTAGPVNFFMKSFSGALTADEAGNGRVSSEIKMHIDQMLVDGDMIGPVSLVLEFRNMDAALTAEFQKFMTEMNNQDLAELGSMNGFFRAVMVFLQKSYEVELREFDVKTQDGNFYLAASIGVDGDKIGAVPNPEIFRSALKGRAHLRVSEGLANRISREISMSQLKVLGSETLKEEELAELNTAADYMGRQQLQMLVDQKFLVAKNGDYRMTLSYQQGELFLNNQSIVLPPQIQ